MVKSFEEHLKKTQHVPKAQSSRAAQAEYEVNNLKKNMVNLEKKSLQLQGMVKAMTIQYAEKGLEWDGKTLDEIFQPAKERNIEKQEGSKTEETMEEQPAQ